jgi:Flp pilus assembly protein TadD
VLQGRIHLETHNLDAAIASFNKALEIKPEYVQAHYFSGIVYQRWSDDQKAYESYSKAFELEPTNAQYLLAAAESLIDLNQLDEAQNLIESKLGYFEHNGALRQLQGQIALLNGDPRKAADIYSQALRLNPDDDMLLEELMWSQYASGLFGQAHESVQRLQVRTKAERTDLMHLEARCLTMMNRSTEARELYLKLTRLAPSDPELWSELGALSWELGDYRRIAQCSVQLIALAPDQHEGYMFKAVNERQKGNLTEAIALFRQAADRAPTSALPHLLLGRALEEAGDREAAILAFNDALAAEPQSAEAAELLRRWNEGQRVTAVPNE